MKSILLSNSRDKIYTVFSQKILNKLRKLTDIDVATCYDKEYIINNKKLFNDVNFIFSTWGMPFFTKDEILTIFPSLKNIFYAAGSVQHFARPFLECNISIHSAYKANAVPVAEYTVSQIILANKGFFQNCYYQSRNQTQKAIDLRQNIRGTYGCKIGIIGAGTIGSTVIKMLKSAYNVEILVFDPFLDDMKAYKMGVKKTSLHELFANCSVISNHLANNEKTKNMLDYSCFCLMSKYSTFINTGRGAQVVENDLIRALKEDTTLSAILDVTDPEPPLEDSQLYSIPNIFLTSHIAGSLGDELFRMAEYMLDDFKMVLANDHPIHQITLDMLQNMA